MCAVLVVATSASRTDKAGGTDDARPRLADAVPPTDNVSMETGAHRRWRWLADDNILPRNVRLSFELLGLIASRQPTSPPAPSWRKHLSSSGGSSSSYR